MIISKDNIEQRKVLLLDAFKDEQLKAEIDGISDELYDKVKAWVESLNRIDPRIANVFSVQSRIKDADTFEEKIFRKNYILDWDVMPGDRFLACECVGRWVHGSNCHACTQIDKGSMQTHRPFLLPQRDLIT